MAGSRLVEDFAAAAQSLNRESATAALQPQAWKKPNGGRHCSSAWLANGARLLMSTRRLLNPTHRQGTPLDPESIQGVVLIEKATMQRNGFQSVIFRSDGDPLPKHL